MWQYTYPNELYHYGIPGMKWGHRKVKPISVSRSKYKSNMKTANRNFQKELNTLKKTGRQNDISAVNKAAVRYDQNRATAKAEYKQAKKEYKQSDEYKARRQKAIKVGAASAGTVLAAYGAYKVSQLSNKSKPFTTDQLRSMGISTFDFKTFKYD